MTTPRRESEVTLEALLSLKRAERPPSEFWGQFEQELRVKQLAAIIEKRPWWHGFGRLGSILRRSGMPLGAVAAVGVAWIGVREFSFSLRPAFAPQLASAASSVRAAATPAVLPSPAPVSAVVATAVPKEAALRSGPNAPDASIADGALVPPSTPLGGDALPAGAFAPTFAQSERMMGASFASAQTVSAASGERDLMGNLPVSYQARLLVAHSRSAEPLAKMISPAEERRSRLLAETTAHSESSGFTPRSSDRLIDNLSEDRLIESIQRYGVDAHSVSFKF
jgi:hypothetical protein